MQHFTKLLILTILAGNLAHPSQAEETGTLQVIIDDKSYDMRLVPGQSDWSGAGFVSVNMYAVPIDEELRKSVRNFNLSFEIVSGEAGNAEAMVTTVDDSGAARFRGTAEDGDWIIALDSMENQTDELVLEGQFDGMVGHTENFRDIDFGNPMTLEGSFTVTLDKL
ncbi:hypothetical protein O4H61_14305 [Roseovarius aestuarii]|nr:hypothetical protein [Roseovarius aestuarii]